MFLWAKFAVLAGMSVKAGLLQDLQAKETPKSSFSGGFMHRFEQVCLILCHLLAERINPQLAKGALTVFSCQCDTSTWP